MLAAEYALGTLRGGARRRFERWLLDDQGLRADVAAWSERLLPLVGAAKPVVPPRRVWDAIESRLPGFSARHGLSAPALGWWNRLGFWRGLSAAFALVAVVALGLASRPVALPQTQFVNVDVVPRSVATIVDPKSGAPVAVVLASATRDELTVQVAPTVEIGPGKVLQLWVARSDVAGLHSAGVLATARPGQSIRVPLPDATTVDRVKAFGLSLEPTGGSPQPTQVLGLGAAVRWSS